MDGLVVRRRARIDIIEIGGSFADASPATADRFYLAAAKTFDFLAAHPRIGPALDRGRGRARGLRTWRVDGFPRHVVDYRATGDGVEIVRIVLGARDLDDALDDD